MTSIFKEKKFEDFTVSDMERGIKESQNKVSKEEFKKKFDAYIGVQKSGITNMLDIPVVIRIAAMQYLVDLTKDDCIYIMKNYSNLKEYYSYEV